MWVTSDTEENAARVLLGISPTRADRVGSQRDVDMRPIIDGAPLEPSRGSLQSAYHKLNGVPVRTLPIRRVSNSRLKQVRASRNLF
jgi:hypothetical protein